MSLLIAIGFASNIGLTTSTNVFNAVNLLTNILCLGRNCTPCCCVIFKLVSGIRELEDAYGDGVIKVTKSEEPVRKKLRG